MSSRRLVIMAVVGVFSSANADLIFVDDNNCPGPGSGMEGDPYCSIQTAIDDACGTFRDGRRRTTEQQRIFWGGRLLMRGTVMTSVVRSY